MTNKKILITGINGFIGSNCAKYFKKNNWDVFGIDIAGSDEVNFIRGEVNFDNLKKFDIQFDVILHLAGTGAVGISQKNPEIERIKTVQSSEDLIKYIEKCNSDARLIYISSAAVYGNKSSFIKEDAQYAPMSVYGEHKIEVENLLKKSNNTNYQIIRLFSVYGEGLRKQVIWDFCNKIKNNLNNKEIECFGTGDEERDFIYIDDVIQLIQLALDTPHIKMIINGASGRATKISKIFEIISDLFGYKGKLNFNNCISPNNPKCLVADISVAKELGYSPSVDMEEGLKRYVKWFQEI